MAKTTNEKQNNTLLSEAMSPLFTGRKTIYIDPIDLSKNENVLAVLARTMIEHLVNRDQMQYLIEYEKGKQPIFYRVKQVRENINIKACANYAKLITDFKVGFEFGSPFMFVQRASDDYRKAAVNQDDKRIATLNEMCWEQGKAGKDIQLAHDFKVTGLGYMLAYPKAEKEEDEIAPFDLVVLNPLNTYCVYTNDAYRKKCMAVTYSRNALTQVTRSTVYTRDWIYTVVNNEIIDKTPNILRKIPIVEFRNDNNKMSCFEAVIPLMDALNISNSDRCNDLAQYVQAILWLNNCRIDENQQKELKDGGLIQTTSTADGKDAKVTYVTAPLNQEQTQALIDYMYAQMLEIAGVPGRESSSGGNTGAAILLSNGWQLAETMAKTAEPLFHDAEMELLDVIIAILRNTPGISEDLRGLKKSDVLPKSSRNKTYDLVSRTAALTNLIKLGVDPHHAFPVVDIFDDNQQVVVDSMPRIDKILFEVYNKVTANDKPDTGDGITVNGVKGANDYNAEQNRENESAV